MLTLLGCEKENLFEALLDAYRDYEPLKIMVAFKLSQNLARFGGRGDLESVVYNLIEWAEAHGKLEQLILGAYEKNPDNPKLKQFYQTIFKDFEKRHLIEFDPLQVNEFGPDIDWQGDREEVQLQSFLRSQPDWYDVGFLQRIIEQSKSVCLVQVPKQEITASGVLIADRYVLTNYHVLCSRETDDLDANAIDIILHFGYITLENGTEQNGKSFRLDREQPVLKFSPTNQLDYVLLKVDREILSTQQEAGNFIKSASWNASTNLARKDGLNLLHHPQGDAMKLSIACDGITGVYPESGIVQYINKSALGSSGSPCFNDQGELVALHHAQRSRAFGMIREGILFSSIYKEIESELE